MQAREREKDNRRDWVIVLLIILIGLVCILCAGGWALRLTPSWKLNSNMESNLDPNSDFLTARSNGLIEPIDASILTRPAWMDLYLTPGASFETGTPVPTTIKNTPLPQQTQTSISIPTILSTPTKTATQWIVIYPTNTRAGSVPTRTPIPPGPSADVRITVTDGSPTYNVGGTITYTITVYNTTGPSTVTGATVTDNFPTALSGITWTCTGSGGGICAPGGAGNINDTITLPVGSSVTYTVNASVSLAATGNLANTATVTVPAGITDPAPANNTATDTSTPVFNVDLQITKTDGVGTYTPGASTTYTIVVTNAGPADVMGATVSDIFPAAQTGSVSWSCVATGSATCTALGSGNINDTVNIPVGETLTYTAIVNTRSSATGDLVNTARVTTPAGYTDNTPGNNTATDTDTSTSSADLQIVKTNNATDYVAGSVKRYVITVSNAGPSDVAGAAVSDVLSTNPNIDPVSVSWSCAISGAATCSPAGTGDINDTVNLSVGSSITYTVVVSVVASPVGSLSNTATVTSGTPDANPGNETATDTDQLIVPSTLPYGNIDTDKNTSIEFIPPDTVVTLQFASPLVVGGHPGDDLIYYEWAQGANPGILMDRITLQLGDGSNWYTILNWGDGAANANTNISAPPGCAGEPDNCVIDAPLLFNLTGITFNLDGLVPNGTYPYFRIISPPVPTDSGDGVEVDAIYIVP